MRYDLLPGEWAGAGVTVALVEGGAVDNGHPSLSGAVTRHSIVTGGLPEEAGPHATMTGSVLAGQPTGQVIGAAPGVDLLSVATGSTASGLAEGIVHAVDAGARVINVSAGYLGCTREDFNTCEGSRILRPAVDYADRRDALVVASAGNHACHDEAEHRLLAPAGFRNIISVGAHHPDGTRWECSPMDADLTAPGVDMLVAVPGGSYTVVSGTSFAAPVVSGLIAAMLSEKPDLEAETLRAQLPGLTLPTGALDPVAALSLAGFTVSNEEGVHPFTIGWAWDTSGDQLDQWLVIEENHSTVSGDWNLQPHHLPWNFHPHSWMEPGRYSDDFVRAFGAVYGVLRLDGERATVSASWSNTWLRSGHISTRYGLAPQYPGWSLHCLDSTQEKPLIRAWSWDLPVAVEVTDLDTRAGEVEIVLSLGEGATPDRAGTLPGVDILAGEDWDDCARRVEDSRRPSGVLNAGSAPWEDQSAYEREKFQVTEYLTDSLIRSGPFTIRMGLNETDTITVPGVRGLQLRYNTTEHRYRFNRDMYQEWRRNSPDG
nr:S8 family serine peptidase [Streptomyces alkaliphilus]